MSGKIWIDGISGFLKLAAGSRRNWQAGRLPYEGSFMRMSAIIIFAVLLAGCKSSQPNPSLTSTQATALALQLANDKADTLYHHRPFQDGRPAQFVTGKWVWTDGCGVALLDYHASVMLASDGSTNSVNVQLLDNSLHSIFPDHRATVPMTIP